MRTDTVVRTPGYEGWNLFLRREGGVVFILHMPRELGDRRTEEWGRACLQFGVEAGSSFDFGFLDPGHDWASETKDKQSYEFGLIKYRFIKSNTEKSMPSWIQFQALMLNTTTKQVSG